MKRAHLIRKRDAFIAVVVGSVVTFGLSIWSNAVAKPVTIDSYLWLARLQEPGIRVGETVLRHLYPLIGYPWNVRLGILYAYGVLVTMWTIVVFIVMTLSRIIVLITRSMAD